MKKEERKKLKRRKRELVKKMSKVHKRSSRDPRVLYWANIEDLRPGSRDFINYPKWQSELFEVCLRLEEKGIMNFHW